MGVTIAIIPFKPLSDDPEARLLMAGFVQDLTNNLSRFSGISLIAPESAVHVRDINDSDTLQSLGADYLISGSFRCQQDRIRMAVRLTRVKDGKIVFAYDYDELIETLFNVQDEVVRQIVNIFQQQIDSDLLAFSYKKNPVSLAAYENYLLGMDYLQKGAAEHDQEARRYFEAALAVDPKYAPAYTGMSLSYFNIWSCQLWDRWDVAKKGAQDYAEKALELDEFDYRALAVAGRLALFSAEYDRAEHYLRKSIRINSNDANNLIQVALSFIFLGLAEEAETLYQKACTLNPLHTDAYFSYGSNIYFELGDFRKAIELGRKLDPRRVWVDFPAYMAAAYYHVSDYDNMAMEWTRYVSRFAKYILSSEEASEEEALQWQMNINPYKGKTNLAPFWAFQSERMGLKSAVPRHTASSAHASFQKKGDLWEMDFGGETVLLKEAKGFHDICRLLQQPDVEVHCSEFMGAGVENEKGIALLDQKAKKEYKRKLLDLQSEMEEARTFNHSDRLATLQKAYDQLLAHLSGSLGLGGKSRLTSTSVDKARSAATLRIRSSIKKIETVHPRLARHLQASVKTGTFCVYRPEVPVTWSL